MKTVKELTIRFVLAILLVQAYFLSFAQDKKIEVDINTKGSGEEASSFFMQPWVWVVGGAVFILLLVALLRGGKKE